jgi:hypothetical protein
VKGDGTQVDIEVQKSDDDDHQRRVRYNGAILTNGFAEIYVNTKVKDGILTISEAAKRADMTEPIFMENMEKFKA